VPRLLLRRGRSPNLFNLLHGPCVCGVNPYIQLRVRRTLTVKSPLRKSLFGSGGGVNHIFRAGECQYCRDTGDLGMGRSSAHHGCIFDHFRSEIATFATPDFGRDASWRRHFFPMNSVSHYLICPPPTRAIAGCCWNLGLGRRGRRRERPLLPTPDRRSR